MIFNPYGLIDLAGTLVTLLLLSIIYKTIYDKKLRSITFHLYIFAALMTFTEFLAVSFDLEKYYLLITSSTTIYF